MKIKLIDSQDIKNPTSYKIYLDEGIVFCSVFGFDRFDCLESESKIIDLKIYQSIKNGIIEYRWKDDDIRIW